MSERRKGDKAQAMELVHQLRRLSMRWAVLMDRFAARQDLHPTDLRALIHLLDAARAGEIATPGLLGKRMGMNSPAVTAMVDRLERSRMITRQADVSDRRRVRLVVTDQAMDRGWAAFGPMVEGLMRVVDRFNAEELATVERFLDQVLSELSVHEQVRPTN